ncbi:siderophore-interacting protein [uncultured Tateyamaria sp.]|uniref:siderophore-interacting protein n=1 Tax=uncultured Tateyamaria sp. TaxID=455651 RepID=UPI00260F725B|nr:siderophore-interacting protein [uncultured Tateyamaria sp.]
MPENTALLPSSATGIFDLLRAEAADHDLTVQTTAQGLDVSTQYGMISARIEDRGVRLHLSAEDEGRLAVLRDAVNAHVEGQFALDWNDVRTGHPANLTILKVADIYPISPSFLRLSLAGTTDHLAHGGYHVRLIAPGAGKIEWPEIDTTGRTIWPDNSPLSHRPVYTIADWRDDSVDIDIFCHDEGRTNTWAATLSVGDPVGLMGPGGSGLPVATRLSLWGDETALPAIRRILRETSGNAVGSVTIAVHEPDDISAFDHAGFDVRWIVRNGAADLAQTLIDEGMREADTYLWFAAGSHEVAIARSFAADHGIGPESRYMAAYWK